MAKTTTENKVNTTETLQEQTEVTEKEVAQAQEAHDGIGTTFDKIIAGFETQMEKAKDEEAKAEYAEIIEELKADKLELQEGLVVGSEQYMKDELFMHQFSIGAGIVMAGVGGVLLFRARKVIGKTKAKIAGWILAGLGVATIGLHIFQLFG